MKRDKLATLAWQHAGVGFKKKKFVATRQGCQLVKPTNENALHFQLSFMGRLKQKIHILLPIFERLFL